MSEATLAAISADADLLEAHERAQIDALLARLREARNGADHVAIRAAVEALSAGTEAFAARRMNRSIAQALTGRRLDDLETR